MLFKAIDLKLRFLLLGSALFFLAVVGPATDAFAQSEAFELFRGRSGPYEVSIGIQPDKPTIGIVQFSVVVVDLETSQPVENASVMIVANNPEGEPTFQSPALNHPREPEFYVGNINFRSPGQWSLLVRINTPDKAEVEIITPLNIRPLVSNPGIEGTFVFALIVVALVGGSTYVWYSARRQKRALRASQ